MSESIIKRGESVTSESMRQENIKRLRVDYGIEWLVMDEDKIIAEFNEKAIEEYALANSLGRYNYGTARAGIIEEHT
jgi:hypothetical protein